MVEIVQANLQRTKQKLSRQKRKRMSSIGVVDSASSFTKRIPPSVTRRKDRVQCSIIRERIYKKNTDVRIIRSQ